MATTSAGINPLFSVILVVLIVSIAVLLDHALRYEKLLHRCQLQIWMWLVLTLASSMQWPSGSGNENTEDDSVGGGGDQLVVLFVWAHVTVFLNLAAILEESLRSRRSIALSRRNLAIQNALRFLPLASWYSTSVAAGSIVFLHATTTAEPNPSGLLVGKLSLGTFLGTFLVLWFLRTSENRRRKISIDMQGIPTTTMDAEAARDGGGIMARFCGVRPRAAKVDYNKASVASEQFNSQGWSDERQWYTWNRPQTIQWFAQKLSSHADSSQEETNAVVELLTPHRITGDVLEGLVDVSQLVVLRVPFGPACRLSDCIVELVEKYPKPRRLNGTRGGFGNRLSRNSDRENDPNPYGADSNYYDAEPSNNSLDLHDREYNNNGLRSRRVNEPSMGVTGGLPLQPDAAPHVPGGQHPHSQNEPVFQGGMSEEQHEKLNNVMKERFGLELPKLKGSDFLEIQKGLSKKKANNTHHATEPLFNDDMPLPHPFSTTSVGGTIDPATTNDYANGSIIPLSRESEQQPPIPSSPIDNRNGPSVSSSTTSIPEHVLQGMPPEIREIAKRRPDLIETMWKQKQQQILPQQPRKPLKTQASTALHAATKRDNGLAALPEIAETGRVDDATGDETYDSDDEDETTSLIHRDNSSINEIPARYKSIDKSMIPSLI